MQVLAEALVQVLAEALVQVLAEILAGAVLLHFVLLQGFAVFGLAACFGGRVCIF